MGSAQKNPLWFIAILLLLIALLLGYIITQPRSYSSHCMLCNILPGDEIIFLSLSRHYTMPVITPSITGVMYFGFIRSDFITDGRFRYNHRRNTAEISFIPYWRPTLKMLAESFCKPCTDLLHPAITDFVLVDAESREVILMNRDQLWEKRDIRIQVDYSRNLVQVTAERVADTTD